MQQTSVVPPALWPFPEGARVRLSAAYLAGMDGTDTQHDRAKTGTVTTRSWGIGVPKVHVRWEDGTPNLYGPRDLERVEVG